MICHLWFFPGLVFFCLSYVIMCQSSRTGIQHKGSGENRPRDRAENHRFQIEAWCFWKFSVVAIIITEYETNNLVSLGVYRLITFCRLDLFIGICYLAGFLQTCFQVTCVIGSHRYASVFHYIENSCLLLDQVVNWMWLENRQLKREQYHPKEEGKGSALQLFVLLWPFLPRYASIWITICVDTNLF